MRHPVGVTLPHEHKTKNMNTILKHEHNTKNVKLMFFIDRKLSFFPHIPHWKGNEFLDTIKVVLNEAIPKTGRQVAFSQVVRIGTHHPSPAGECVPPLTDTVVL